MESESSHGDTLYPIPHFRQPEPEHVSQRVIDALLALWTRFPTMRFGQLVMNVSRVPGGFADTWEWSNEKWLAAIADAEKSWNC